MTERAAAPRISLIMTAWNAAPFIDEAIDSALGQTRPPDEIIVNDDGSTDGTVDVLRQYGERVTVLTGAHRGQSDGKNRAFARSTGDLIAPLDADDVWLPHRLERQLAALADDPSVEMVFGATDEFVDAGGAAHTRQPRLGAVGPLLSAALLRRTLFERVGPFRPGVQLGDWVDWWSRATLAGVRHLELTEVLCRRRLHAHNTTVERVDRRDEYLRIMRERLAARRQAP